MSWHLSLQIWSRDSGQWMPCFDSCQSPIRWMSFVKLIELRLQVPILARKMWKCEIWHWLPCAADGWVGRWTGGWTDLRSLDYQNFSDAYITKFSCPWCSTTNFEIWSSFYFSIRSFWRNTWTCWGIHESYQNVPWLLWPKQWPSVFRGKTEIMGLLSCFGFQKFLSMCNYLSHATCNWTQHCWPSTLNIVG